MSIQDCCPTSAPDECPWPMTCWARATCVRLPGPDAAAASTAPSNGPRTDPAAASSRLTCPVCGITPNNVGTLERAAHHVFHCDHLAGDYRCIEFVRRLSGAKENPDA